MRFTKMEGLGNDYVYLDCTRKTPDDLPELARRVSDRHFGVGSDGLICIFPSQKADFRMAIYNADGSQAEMCGNGIRCVGKFVYDKGLTDKTELRIETLAGVKELDLSVVGGKVVAASVDMGVPQVEEAAVFHGKTQEYQGVPVSMGNPHLVCVVDDVRVIDLPVEGTALAADRRFPQGVNVEFAHIIDRSHILMRVWERGSGETLACGTGACATAAACATLGLTDRDVQVSLPGGLLYIQWREDGHIQMTGPARTVFEGEWPEDASAK